MNEKEESPKVKFNQKDYVKSAEDVIKYLEKEEFSVITNPKRGSRDILTTSAIRNILGSTSEIYDMVRSQGPEAVRDKLAYLKVKLIYQSGRNAAVKRFVEVSKLIQALDLLEEKYYQKSEEKDKIILFCRYMEALVAYFKYYGGKD
ncbi:type III-A CRISPR-associated protein Csm2 [Ligilactobacillus ruminis]|uniref:type III-A CRISPR-associated protein Csm2 n=1 Tax=Ligilactobacillus ruminis TaxID=1623 RepID=UPI0022E4E5EA|nr:type III-A CRISPR-associated protein Csm2 [Ligilactobacillus ruminis]